MGAFFSSGSNDDFEELEQDPVATGDLILLRMTAITDGIALNPAVAAQSETALYGDQPAHRRMELPDWDRVCVVVEWGYNDRGKLVPPAQLHSFGGLQPCVAIAYSDCLQVHTLSKIMKDPEFSVVAVRRFTPPLHDFTEEEEPEDVEAGRRPRIDMAQQLNRAVQQMEGKLWTELSAASSRHNRKPHNSKHTIGRDGHDKPWQDSSLQEMFERLRSYTKFLHKDALQAKYVEAQAASLEHSAMELKLKEMKEKGWFSCKKKDRRSSSAVAPELNEDTVDEFGELGGSGSALAKLKVKKRFENMAVEARDSMLQDVDSEEDWRQLVEQALGRQVSTEDAMNMQLSICEEWQLSVPEAETALLMLCGRFDLGAQLSAEVVLHLYRRAGLFSSDKVVDLEKFWSPSSFDPENHWDPTGLFGSNDRMQDLLPPGRKLRNIEVLFHAQEARRTAAARATQRFDGILNCLRISKSKVGRGDTIVA